VKIIKDLGLAAISLFGLFIAVFIGVSLVWKEIERRSIYCVLAKPVRRSEFIAGKYAGLVLTLAVNVAVMTMAFYLVLGYMAWTESPEFRRAWSAPATDPRLLVAIGLIFVELMVVTAVALFFSTFSTPMLSAALTIAIVVIGHLSEELARLSEPGSSEMVRLLTIGLYHLLPDLSAFDVKSPVVHGLPIPAGFVLVSVAYGALYISGLLAAAMLVFSRRDLP
jgi:Cu-processing system permease protein